MILYFIDVIFIELLLLSLLVVCRDAKSVTDVWRRQSIFNHFFCLILALIDRLRSRIDSMFVVLIWLIFVGFFFEGGGEADLHRRAISTVWLIHSNRLDWLNRLNRAIGPGLAIHQRLMSIKRRRGVRSFLDRFVAIWFPFRGLNRCCCCCCCCWQWWCCCCCCCCCLYAGTIPANLLIKIERTGTGRLAPFWIGWRAIRSFRHSFETGLLVKRCEFGGGGIAAGLQRLLGWRRSPWLPILIASPGSSWFKPADYSLLIGLSPSLLPVDWFIGWWIHRFSFLDGFLMCFKKKTKQKQNVF